MHVHMLELFLALYAEKQKLPAGRLKHRMDVAQSYLLSTDELAYLISVYDRRGRHNEDVSDGMYEKLYPVL